MCSAVPPLHDVQSENFTCNFSIEKFEIGFLYFVMDASVRRLQLSGI
jgi:hypothetical protein